MWGATRMVSGGHSDPYEVCLPCAGGHQDVHLAVRPSLRLRDMHKKEQIKVCIAGVLRFCLHVLRLARSLLWAVFLPPSSFLPVPLSSHCPCRISWLPLYAPAVRECCGDRKKYTRCMECFSCEKLYSRAWGLYYVRQYSWPPLLGLVSADGGEHGDHGAQHAQHGTVLAEPLAAQPDTSNYYSQQAYTDTFAPTGSEGFYDPYASNFLTQEQDRTDAGLLGGLTIGVLITVFLAALLGSIVAPALTAAVTRCQRIYSSGTLNINWYISNR